MYMRWKNTNKTFADKGLAPPQNTLYKMFAKAEPTKREREGRKEGEVAELLNINK